MNLLGMVVGAHDELNEGDEVVGHVEKFEYVATLQVDVDNLMYSLSRKIMCFAIVYEPPPCRR